MTDEEHMDAAMDAVVVHEAATSHPSFFVAGHRAELVCADCGLVLYEGPTFDDPVDGWDLFEFLPGRDH